MELRRKTERLILRPFELRDYASWRDARAGMLPAQNVWDHAAKNAKERSREAFRKILKIQRDNRKKDRFYDLGVFLKEGPLIGAVSLMDLSRGVFQNAYLGYQVFNRHWGKGYGAEAVRAAVDVGFQDLKLHRLEAGIEPGNDRSIRLAKRLGFRREGFSKRKLYLRGKWVNIYNYALTSEEAGIPYRRPPDLGTTRY